MARRKRTKKKTYKRSFAAVAELERVPDPAPRIIHKSCGRKTRLGINSFVWNLFHVNEHFPKGKKLTNAALENAVRKEFKHRHVLIDSLDVGNSSINDWRRRYNAGTLSPGLPQPKRLALRYNNNGEPVEPRMGNRVRSEEEIAMECIKYNIDDDRFTDVIRRVKARQARERNA